MTFDFAAARQNMVETQIRTNDVTDPAVQKAMRASPREDFCGGARHLAYADTEVEYAPGRWLMRPRDIGKLLHALKPKAGERALAIAAPSAADVLRPIGLEVVEAMARAVGQRDLPRAARRPDLRGSEQVLSAGRSACSG